MRIDGIVSRLRYYFDRIFFSSDLDPVLAPHLFEIDIEHVRELKQVREDVSHFTANFAPSSTSTGSHFSKRATLLTNRRCELTELLAEKKPNAVHGRGVPALRTTHLMRFPFELVEIRHFVLY